MRRLILGLGLLLASLPCARAQWIVQDSGTTADLRGIDSAGPGIAWASGTNGTVLRTEDAGYLWQRCTVPPGAEHLDFRGIQAFDANTAIVMSSGPGDLSRLYKTTDGCQTWKLIFTNPDKEGFWDAILLNRFDKDGELLGDPVNGRFAFWRTDDKGATWTRMATKGLDALPHEGVFAASNSALFLDERFATGFVTGGAEHARFLSEDTGDTGGFAVRDLPLRNGSQSAGGFSIDDRAWCCRVAVGGDYLKPDDRTGTAAYTQDGGKTWHAAQTQPHGYRSSVAYSPSLKAWIAVGPNGTDLSTDYCRTWRALLPNPALHEPAGANRDWNALSLPFVVGPHGRIGHLDPRGLAR